MAESVVQIQSGTKSFRRGQAVLTDVSLQVQAGEMVALIGASGSGKSTLLRVIAGLELLDRNSGDMSLFGQSTQRAGRATRNLKLLRRDVGVIFQQFNLVGRLSLLVNVLTGRLGRVPQWRSLLGLFSRPDRLKALEALHRVGMAEFCHRRASTLSGGQQQRGAIARTLAQQARLILADEPIASLDPASAEQVMQLLREINRKDGVTVIVSLHQIEHALKHCPRVIALKSGEVVFDGPTSAIDQSTLGELYGVDTDILGLKHERHTTTGSAPVSVVAKTAESPHQSTKRAREAALARAL
ncbi:MAG: phosphonate ABC transporter ATP-binding protein [Gammaproteobacteria bacterium]|nr:phosphonate ABC transporter ATP-binding protein [Gammaproteobacteria bacterium]